MGQRNRHTPKFRARLSQWQAMLLLCLFLAVRGFVPTGFMPAPLSGGTPYGLCHGDSRSVQLLQFLARQHSEHKHHGGEHQHDALTAHTFADNHCNFSAGTNLAVAPQLDLASFARGLHPLVGDSYKLSLTRPAYILPPTRAPPIPRRS